MDINKEILMKRQQELIAVRDRYVAETNLIIGRLCEVDEMLKVLETKKVEEKKDA